MAMGLAHRRKRTFPSREAAEAAMEPPRHPSLRLLAVPCYELSCRDPECDPE
ncbi:MAG: hypothetical protein OXH59_16290 [Rhodospirillaceae bacterium]|nr:hypothetical protein [Rhodospirillaceae bacterium]